VCKLNDTIIMYNDLTIACVYFLAPPRPWLKIQLVYFAQIYKQSIAKILYIIMVLFVLCAATLSRRNSRSTGEFFLAVVDMCANPFDNGNKLGIACEKTCHNPYVSRAYSHKKRPHSIPCLFHQRKAQRNGVSTVNRHHMLSERHMSGLCVLLFGSYSVYIACPFIS